MYSRQVLYHSTTLSALNHFLVYTIASFAPFAVILMSIHSHFPEAMEGLGHDSSGRTPAYQV
jgi:hypothetical protein